LFIDYKRETEHNTDGDTCYFTHFYDYVVGVIT